MGVTHVTVVIRNPADPEKTWEGLFLVDTGAIDCLVPKPHLEAIDQDSTSLGQMNYGVTVNSPVKYDTTSGKLSVTLCPDLS